MDNRRVKSSKMNAGGWPGFQLFSLPSMLV